MDVFCFGVVIFTIMVGKYPFSDLKTYENLFRDSDIADIYEKRFFKDHGITRASHPRDLLELIWACFDTNYETRINM